jgi:hypothetical protein
MGSGAAAGTGADELELELEFEVSELELELELDELLRALAAPAGARGGAGGVILAHSAAGSMGQ